MPKYKVGDVSALFPKPKESTTESGKKLQSLFNQFHTKKNTSLPQSPKVHPKPLKKRQIENEETENQSKSVKNKKRKFSSLNSLKSDVSNFIAKFKNPNDLEETGAPENKKVKVENSSVAEIDFPRRKKKGKKFKFEDFQSKVLSDYSVIQSLPEEPSFVSNKASNFDSPKNIKLKSGFIKKAKYQNTSKDHKNAGTDNFVKKPLYTNDFKDILKSENEKKRIKKKSKKRKAENTASHVQNSDTVKSVQKKSRKLEEPDFIQLPDNNNIEEDYESYMQISEPIKHIQKKRLDSNKEGMTVKKMDDEEVLSRTLFIGNLPTNTTGKALKKFFSRFGPVEKIRYRPIVTDRNKFFKQGGPKEQNLHYAAESVSGFVVFKDKQHAVDALALSGSLFQNRHITVDFALPAGSKKHYDSYRSVFIGNLPFGIQDETVWNAFSECGKIEAVRIIRDRLTGIGKGFGYVQFNDVKAKEKALALENLEIEGRPIRIKTVDSNQKTQKQPKLEKSFKRDPFKSRAIKYKKTHNDKNSRKSVKKIMKKQKNVHEKKKLASLLQKSMK